MGTVPAHLPWCGPKKICWCEPQRYALVIVIGAVVFAAQVAVGLQAESVAVLTDSAHVASDVVASSVSFYVALRVRSHDRADEVRGRYARLSALLLLAALAWAAWEAVGRLRSETQHEVIGWLVVAIATAGLLGNLVQLAILHPEQTVTAHLQRWHLFEDVGSSMVVIVSGGIIWATGWNDADAWGSLLVVAFVGVFALKRLLGLGQEHHH